MPCRTVFLGSPATAVPSLQAAAAHPAVELVGVLTQPDRPAGRRRRLQASPVRIAAEALGLPVRTPERIGVADAVESLRAWRPELLVICAYGQLLSQAVLDLPPLGCYNLHFSLLPRWRGASPVQAAILAGDAATGVSLQRVVLALDAGPIAAESPPLAILPADTAGSLGDRLAQAAAQLLSQSLSALGGGAPSLHAQQPGEVTLCRTLRKTDGAIRWAAETAAEIERKVRAYTPWPGCHGYLGRRRLRLVRVSVAQGPALGSAQAEPGMLSPEGLVPAREGVVQLLDVQPQGKRVMTLAEFMRGNPQAAGLRLTEDPTP